MINIIFDVPLSVDPYNQDKIDQMLVKPRELKSLGARDGVRTPWIFEKSAFRFYRQDTKPLLDKCFNNDWQYVKAKVEYLIKGDDDRDKVK